MRHIKLPIILFFIIMVVFSILNVLIGVVLEYNYRVSIAQTSLEIPRSEYGHCEGLPLTNTTICLRKWVSSWYKFTPTLDGTLISFEEFKEKGGDCGNYAELYKTIGKELGFKTKNIMIEIEPVTLKSVGIGHVVVSLPINTCDHSMVLVTLPTQIICCTDLFTHTINTPTNHITKWVLSVRVLS